MAGRGQEWLDQVRFAVLDLSGPWRLTFDTMLPDATQVADPFHLVKLANSKLDECRRRVQNETLGHRGHKSDPLYRCRRLLTKADERLDDRGRSKLTGLLDAGDPRGEVRMAWHAKEGHHDRELALEFVTRLGGDLQDNECPPEVRQLGRTIIRWRHQIAAWHQAHVSNGPTEAANNLIKRVKRVAFGFRRFANYRIRTLLYAGRPNWDLLATITPWSCHDLPKPRVQQIVATPVREPAPQCLAQLRDLAAQLALGHLGENLGITLTADERGEHLPSGHTQHV